MVEIASNIEKMVLSSVGEYGPIALRQEPLGFFANIVAEQARQYLDSFPGNDASVCNSQHSWFQLVAGEVVMDREHLEDLSNALLYRNALTGVATRCKDYLQLPIADAHLFDAWGWQLKQESNEQRDSFSKIHNAIIGASVFGHPEPHQGLFFAKPTEYLAIGFVKSGRPFEQVFAEIERLVSRRGMGCYVWLV